MTPTRTYRRLHRLAGEQLRRREVLDRLKSDSRYIYKGKGGSRESISCAGENWAWEPWARQVYWRGLQGSWLVVIERLNYSTIIDGRVCPVSPGM